MITINVVLLISWLVVSHWICDFIFQAEEWANSKSYSLKGLLKHTFTYSILMTVSWFFFLENRSNILWFFGITLITHTLTDFFTSKLVAKKFADKYYGSPIPNFGAFTTIGLDQVIHYITLLLTLHFFI